MKQYESRQDRLNRHFRKVEAMVRQGHSIEDILLNCPALSRIDVLDIDQRIFANDMRRRENGI